MSTPAYDDLFKLYFKYVEDTEAPIQFHRWSLIAAVGALLGRDYYLPFGAGRIFPNSYIMLVGDPGTRKSSAIKGVKKILASSGYSFFSAEKTTKEKFLLDLEGLPDEPENRYNSSGRSGRSSAITPGDILANLTLGEDGAGNATVPRECFICADEFNEFTGSGNLDFFSLLGALWDWDDEAASYRYRLKNSKSVAIYQPTISILGGNTHTNIQTAFPAEALGQGFMSRLLFIHSEASGKRITFPKPPPESLATSLIEYIREIKTSVQGAATLTAASERALDTIYRSWKEIDDYRFKHYSTRRFTHLLKLCLICSASRKSVVIDMQDVLLANTILTHAEHAMPKALGEFGKSKNSEAAQTIMSTLYAAKAPVTSNELYKIVSRDIDRREQLAEILNSLQTAGKIQVVKGANGMAGFLPLQKAPNSAAVFVDFKLLD